MKKQIVASGFLVASLSTVLGIAAAQAAEVAIDCGKKRSINAALATLSRQGPNTIFITGACSEAVVVDGYANLTLAGNAGAVLNDATPSEPTDNYVVEIRNSTNVTLRGLTVNGGSTGVQCGNFASCYLTDVTLQNAAHYGAAFSRSGGVISGASVIQNNGLAGVALFNASNLGIFSSPGPAVVIRGNRGFAGIWVTGQSSASLAAVTIQNNLGTGVQVDTSSRLNLASSTVTGSASHGVTLSASVGVFLDANTITGNGGHGIVVSSLSHARFRWNENNAPHNVSGNASSPDVQCASGTAVTVEATTSITGGTTNCTDIP